MTPPAVDQIHGAVGIFEDERVDRLSTVVELVYERPLQVILERALGLTCSRETDAAALIVVLYVVRAEKEVIPAAPAKDRWRPDGAPRPHDIGGVEHARVLGPRDEVGGRERVEEQLLVVHRRVGGVDPVRR